MIHYTKGELWELFDYLERCGWWVEGVDGPSTHHGNTTLMRIFKHHVTNPTKLIQEIKGHRKCEKEYEYLFNLQLREVPLHINESNFKDITWRLKIGK